MIPFSKQQKTNASQRMQRLINAINNEINNTSFGYIGSMQRGNRDRITVTDGAFDVDVDIFVPSNFTDVNAQKIYSEIKQIIKNCLRDGEQVMLKHSNDGSEKAIIHIYSNNANYSFDLAIKTHNNYLLSHSKIGNYFY